MSDAYARLSPEALGGATDEQFQWAMSLVHRCEGGGSHFSHYLPHPRWRDGRAIPVGNVTGAQVSVWGGFTRIHTIHHTLGGATDEQFQCAMSLVHRCEGLVILTHTSPHIRHHSSPQTLCVHSYSRTFGNAAPGGGMGVACLYR